MPYLVRFIILEMEPAFGFAPNVPRLPSGRIAIYALQAKWGDRRVLPPRNLVHNQRCCYYTTTTIMEPSVGTAPAFPVYETGVLLLDEQGMVRNRGIAPLLTASEAVVLSVTQVPYKWCPPKESHPEL